MGPQNASRRMDGSTGSSTVHYWLSARPPMFWVYTLLTLSHLLSATYAPIQDCDEVFNFWEPTHYLLHGYGLQTWELSPEYSIRSWLYVALHTLPIKVLSFLPGLAENKVMQFYVLRSFLGGTAAFTEAKLFESMWYGHGRTHPIRSMAYLCFAATSTGSFISSASFLPSTFAMYCVTLAMANFSNYDVDSQDGGFFVWLAAGTILGWPFAGALCTPFVLHEVAVANRDSTSFVIANDRIRRAAMYSFAILAVEVLCDSWFTKRIHSVPLNIVLYNVFSGSSKGPDLYGTEPWYFYLLNLTLNFNIIWILAILAYPERLISHVVFASPPPQRLTLQRFLHISATHGLFPLWLLIFSAQPHKEERFLYPIYPCIMFSAGCCIEHLFEDLQRLLQPTARPPATNKSTATTTTRKHTMNKLLPRATALATIALAFPSVWRSTGLATAYRAPLEIYSAPLQTFTALPTHSSTEKTVCVGKEWHRFPSSFFLPSVPPAARTRLKFIPSSFHGLLPGEFADARPSDPYPPRGTWAIPADMNDANREEMSHYTDIAACDFLVDLSLPSVRASDEEPDYVALGKSGEGAWEVLKCAPFLDAGRTGLIGRVGWVPARWRAWGEYCMLWRRRDFLDEEEEEDTAGGA